jgi:hypothetical protein
MILEIMQNEGEKLSEKRAGAVRQIKNQKKQS